MKSIMHMGSATVALAAALTIGAAHADDTNSARLETSRLDQSTAAIGGSRVSSRISQDFTAFAGSENNASQLVAGLRNGTPITLASPAGGNAPPSTLTFTPPTRPMGYGNVFISLALAKQRLASIGITQPTASQIEAALMGGTVTAGSGATARTVYLQGVLTQRSGGMGWGAIARSQGANLGSVVSALQRVNHDQSAIRAHEGYFVTAGGRVASGGSADRVSADGENVRGRGIVTAAGGAAEVAPGNRSAGAIVTGGGAVRGNGVSATGGGMGQARGHSR